MNPHELLPHRYPFLLVDRIDAVERGRRAVGRKRVTGSEWLAVSTGYGEARLAMPHALIVEALAQLSAAVIAGLEAHPAGVVGYFMGCDRVRLRGAAEPGDTLDLTVDLLQYRRGICRTRGVARVGSLELVRATLTTIVRPATVPTPA